TPIVMSFIQRLKLEAKPFLVACAFVANTASLLLPVSNLTNLLFQSAFKTSFVTFTLYMAAAQFAVVILNYWLLSRLYRNSLPETFDQDLPPADSVITDRLFFQAAIWVLGFVLFGYFVGAQIGLQPYIVAGLGCVILLFCGLMRNKVQLTKLHNEISWSLFPFVLGLFVVMRGVENLGLAKLMAAGLQHIGNHPLALITTNAFAGAIGSNLINNIPMALLSISVLNELPGSGITSQLGAILGCNLGPNITITGSLATMLVISSARKRGADLSAYEFFKAGVWITPLLLIAGSVVLWLTDMVLAGVVR
ncbi:MAG TPA: ArsB/NhaD family transporter, partial [Chroococcales cyanobacterium]